MCSDDALVVAHQVAGEAARLGVYIINMYNNGIVPNLRLAASVRHNARRRGRRRYNTLAFCNCLRTGSVRGKEIDFVATRGQDEKLYIQVAYEITENNREREFGNLEAIRDNYPKMVLSRDRIQLSSNGIVHKNIVDFLLDR